MLSLNLSILILILISFFSMTYLYLNLSEFNRKQKICIKAVTKLQQKHRDSLKKLQKLNPLAKSLRIEKRLAENSLKTAPHPAAKTAALAWLKSVRLRQSSLKGLQKGILKAIDLSTLQQKSKAFIKHQSRLKALNVSYILTKKPKTSITPSYFLKDSFTKLKTIEMNIPLKIIPEKKSNFFKPNKNIKRSHYKCSATITTKNQKLTSIKIIADKHSLKQLVF